VKRNCLIIGGNGFIGGHLCEELAMEGHVVTVLDVSLGGFRQVKGFVDKMHLGSITNKELLREIIYDQEISVIYNLAGISHTVSSAMGARAAYEAGVYGFVCLLDVCREFTEERHWHFERILVASSSLISGILKCDPVTLEVESNEAWVNTARSYHPYVSNKIAMEMALWDYHVLTGQSVTQMRFGTAFGPRMMPGVVEHYFIKGALEDEQITVHGDGSQWRQCLYVKDIVQAQVKCLRPEARNQIVYLVPRWKTTVLQMAQAMQEINPNVGIVHTDKRAIDIRVSYIDPTHTEELLEWKATTPFVEGMRVAYEWHIKNPAWL